VSTAGRLDLNRFAVPRVAVSLWQLFSTLVPLIAVWGLAAATFGRSAWLTLVLLLVSIGLRSRTVVLQHDCGHGSLFRARWVNDLAGTLLGLVNWMPYDYWRRTHILHHSNSSRMEGRSELGSIMTLTVREYQALRPGQKLAYRVYRHPLFLCGFGGPFQFLLKHRFPWDTPRSWRREWASVGITNAGLIAALVALSAVFGLKAVLWVELPVIAVTSAIAVWFIYVQHVFPGGYFASGDAWNVAEASTRGSSYYQLPALLRWCTASVGLHHVHHYHTRIPNYRLEECMQAHSELQVPPLTLGASLSCGDLKLWDEQAQQFVGFPAAAQLKERAA
jgi:omega-6 fatty acid desaturase (delta-12 desaturase)